MSKSIANHQNLSLYSKSDLSNIRKCVILFFSRLKEENCGSLSRILVSTEKTRRHHCATSNPRRKNGKESVNAPITGGIFIFFSLTDRRRKHMLQLIYNSMPPYTPQKIHARRRDSALSGDLKKTDLKLILISHYLHFN